MVDQKRSAAVSAEHVTELKKRCADLVRRAILTLDALPDRERRFLSTNLQSSMPTPVADWAHYRIDEFEAPSKRPRINVTPKDVSRFLEVLRWLAWLETENNGARDVKIIMARTYGVSWLRLAEQFGRSEYTVQRWQNGAFAAMTAKFWHEIEGMD